MMTTRATLRTMGTPLLFAKPHPRLSRAAFVPLSTSAAPASDRVSPEAPSKISWDSRQPIQLRTRDREPENMPPICIQVRIVA